MVDASLFEGLPHAAGRFVLARACADPGAPLPDEELRAAVGNPREAEWLLDAAQRTWALGLIWPRVRREQRDFLPPEARQAFTDAYLGHVARGEGMRRRLERCLERLNAARIPVILLKGAALVGTVYAAPEERFLGDLDLLVPDADLERARAALAGDASGATPDVPGHRHLGGLRFAAGTVVELHGVAAHLSNWPRTQEGDLFEHAVSATVGGQAALRLDLPDTYLHVACHRVRHGLLAWPLLAADLRRLEAHPEWPGDLWNTLWPAAECARAGRAFAVAVAFAHGARLPDGLRRLLPDRFAREVETTARIGWRAALDYRRGVSVSCENSWIAEDARVRRAEVASLIVPRLGSAWGRGGRVLGTLLFPVRLVARAGAFVVGSARWQLFVRRYR